MPNKTTQKKYFILFLIFFSCTNAWGQHAEDTTTTHKRKKKVTIIPLPIIYYTPETKLAAGFLGVCLFKTSPQTRTSNIDLATVITSRKQRLFDIEVNMFTPQEKYFIKSSIYLAKFPESFFGIGNDRPNIPEKIDYSIARGNLRVLRKIKEKTFVGMQYQFFGTYRVMQDKNTPNPIPTGGRGSQMSGFGFAFVYDSRDNIVNARKGMYFEVSNYGYLKALGSEFESFQLYIDARKYIKINRKGILAVQGIGNFNVGDVPFKMLGTLGGVYQMRGFYNGRYRDKIAIIFQAEYRHILTERWGFTVFGSVGDVGKNISDYGSKGMKFAGGVGLRIKLSKKENVNVRFDFGVGTKSSLKPYFNVAEAF